MNKVLKDLSFTMAYLDDIIIYSKTAEEHLDHLQQVFHKPFMKLSNCHFLTKEIQYLVHVLSTTGIKPLPPKTTVIKLMEPLHNAKQVSISWPCWLLPQVYQEFCSDSKTAHSPCP